MWLDTIAADAVNALNGSPLHQQVSALIRGSISDGSLPPGTQVPTELELQDKFSVSRSVVRQALTGLAADGLIQRGRGRGTVVAPHHEHHRHIQRMHGLSAQISTSVEPVRTEVLSLSEESDPRASTALNTNDLLSLRRRRSVDEEAIAIIHTWLPLELASSLTAAELTDASLHATLASKFGVPVTAGRRQIRAVPASTTLAAELSLPIGTPLLLLEGTSLDDGGVPVEFFSTWHRADRVVFDIKVGTTTQSPTHRRSEAPDSAGEETAASHSDVVSRIQALTAELSKLTAQLN